jgi:hypothetical protein
MAKRKMTKKDWTILANVEENERREDMAKELNSAIARLVSEALETRKVYLCGNLPAFHPNRIDVMTGV